MITITVMSEFKRIAVLGAGNIGTALIGGMLKAGLAVPGAAYRDGPERGARAPGGGAILDHGNGRRQP